MNVNGVTTAANAYGIYKNSNPKTEKARENIESKNAQKAAGQSGVVYEASPEAKAYTAEKAKEDKSSTDGVVKKSYNAASPDVIAKLQADAEERVNSLKSLVQKLLGAQVTDVFAALRNGQVPVDEATRAAAEKSISEGGEYSVENVSDNIVNFAMALTGGDPSKIEEMRAAFQKGYDQAKETFGGELPEISQRTYDATMEKFDKWAAGELTYGE